MLETMMTVRCSRSKLHWSHFYRWKGEAFWKIETNAHRRANCDSCVAETGSQFALNFSFARFRRSATHKSRYSGGGGRGSEEWKQFCDPSSQSTDWVINWWLKVENFPREKKERLTNTCETKADKKKLLSVVVRLSFLLLTSFFSTGERKISPANEFSFHNFLRFFLSPLSSNFCHW